MTSSYCDVMTQTTLCTFSYLTVDVFLTVVTRSIKTMKNLRLQLKLDKSTKCSEKIGCTLARGSQVLQAGGVSFEDCQLFIVSVLITQLKTASFFRLVYRLKIVNSL